MQLCHILYARNIWDDQDYYYYEKQHSVKENDVIMQPPTPLPHNKVHQFLFSLAVEQHYNLYKIKLL